MNKYLVDLREDGLGGWTWGLAGVLNLPWTAEPVQQGTIVLLTVDRKRRQGDARQCSRCDGTVGKS